jgi:hypothetical protein
VANNLCFFWQELTVRSIKRPLQRILDHYALLLASPVILDSNFAERQPHLGPDFAILCFQWFIASQMAVPALFWTALASRTFSNSSWGRSSERPFAFLFAFSETDPQQSQPA